MMSLVLCLSSLPPFLPPLCFSFCLRCALFSLSKPTHFPKSKSRSEGPGRVKEEKSLEGKITGLVAAVGNWTQSYRPFQGPGANCPPEDGLGEASLCGSHPGLPQRRRTFPRTARCSAWRWTKWAPFQVSERCGVRLKTLGKQ